MLSIKYFRIVMVVIVTFVFGYRVMAEPAPQYAFKVPSLSEFLTTAKSVLHHSDLDDGYISNLVEVLDQEFDYRYRATATYKEYRAAFDVLKIDLSGTPPVAYPRIDLEEWIAGIVNAWLAENPIDLDSLKELRFDDFQATIEQRDFNNDGKHEWLLDLIKGADGSYFEYRNWLIITREGKGYRAIAVPIWPGYHGEWDFPSAYSQQPYEIEFKDITADGIPEWFIGRDISPWGNIPGQSYQELMLTWQDGHMVNLIASSDHIATANLDDDPALETFSDHEIYDSWGCYTNSKSVFDWNGRDFDKLGKPIIERKYCEAHDAEAAMWRRDFESAVQNYEAFLEIHKQDYTDYLGCLDSGQVECDPYFGISILQIYEYFLGRRVIAYALLGDQQHVDSSIAELRVILATPYPDTFGQAILGVTSTNPEEICKTAYAFFVPEDRHYYSYNTPYSLFTPGHIYEDVGTNQSSPVFFYDGRPDPIKAGCDITIFSPQPTPTPTATLTPAPTYTPYPRRTVEQKLVNDSTPTSWRFRDGDYEAIIWISDHINERYNRYTDDALQMQYWKGLALEALGRPQEALATYIALAKEAPKSVWGELARLHFQCTAGC